MNMRPAETKDPLPAAISAVRSLDQSEKLILKAWLSDLLLIRASKASRVQKIRGALRSTFAKKATLPIAKAIAAQVKKHGWDKRSSRTKWALAASGVGIAVFGGQSAGIAALGGAIGVPLWVVFGGGAAIAKIMLDEIAREITLRDGFTKPSSYDPTEDAIPGDYMDITSKSEQVSKNSPGYRK
jgi:hypothetical protein